MQLLTTSSKCLRRSVEDWHLAYHNADRTFTAISLVTLAERTCKALRCTGQLHTDPDPDIAVLHVKLTKQADITSQAFNVITDTLQQQGQGQHKKPPGKPQGNHNRPQKPDLYYKAPSNPTTSHKHDGRDWYWCPKCGRDQQGKWVCTHLPADHKDTFTRKRRGEQQHNPAPKTPRTPTSSANNANTTFTQANLAQLTQAHAELTALLAAATQLPSFAVPPPPVPAIQPPPTLPATTPADLLDMDNW